jgi:hypothetical protein
MELMILTWIFFVAAAVTLSLLWAFGFLGV